MNAIGMNSENGKNVWFASEINAFTLPVYPVIALARVGNMRR